MLPLSVLLCASLAILRSDPAADRPAEDGPSGCLAFVGSLEHEGQPFSGTARVKLSISCGTRHMWSHDGTGEWCAEPRGWFEVEVQRGELSVPLGGPRMRALPDELQRMPAGCAVHVWIDLGTGFERLDGPFLLPGAGPPPQPGVRLPMSPLEVPVFLAAYVAELLRGGAEEEEGGQPTAEGRAQYDLEARDLLETGWDYSLLLRAKEQADLMGELVHLADGGLWAWDWLGPGNIGGRVRSILIHPTQPDKMWIGSAGGGIWRTLDGGLGWEPVDDFLPSLSVCALAMDSTDPNVLYAGTGEWTGSSSGNTDSIITTGIGGIGILKSTDGGLSWSPLPLTSGDQRFRYVTRIAHNPEVAGDFWVTTFGAGPSNLDGYLFHFTNGGAMMTGPILSTGSALTDVDIHPSDPDRILVGGNGGIWFSDDGFASWQTSNTNDYQVFTSTGRCEVDITEAAGVTYYTASVNQADGQLWRSLSAGADVWSLLHQGSNYLASPKQNQGNYDNALWVDPLNPQIIVFGGINLWRTMDAGVSVAPISDWLVYHLGLSAHSDQHVIVSHPSYGVGGNRRVFFGNDGGVQSAPDVLNVSPYAGWVNLATNLGITQFYFGSAAADGSSAVCGAQDNSFLRWRPNDGPGSWFQLYTGDGGPSQYDSLAPLVIYASIQRANLFKSIDGGWVYLPSTTGIADLGAVDGPFYADFDIDHEQPTRLILGSRSLWRTINGAANWLPVRPPQISGDGTALNCQRVEYSEADTDLVWVGYTAGRVSLSQNGGLNWTDVDDNPASCDGSSASLPNATVTAIVTHPTDANRAWIAFGGYEARRVWFTADRGASWVCRSGPPLASGSGTTLPWANVNTLAVHPQNGEWLYAGTDVGIFASQDGGQSWSKAPRFAGLGSEGPVNVRVDDLFWMGPYLMAATHGRGLYRARPLTIVYADVAYTGPEDGSFEHPYNTAEEAIEAAGNGTAVVMRTGTYPEGSVIFYKTGTVTVTGGTVVIR